MSFASDVKEEIGKQYDKGRHCQIAQLAVIFALTGHIKRDFKNENYIEMRTETLTVAKKSYMLLKCMFDISPEVMIRTHNLMARSKNYFICIKDSENVLEVLRTIKLLSDEDTWGDFNAVNQLIIRNTCCKRASFSATVAPSRVMVPSSGNFRLVIRFKRVDFPQPDGPTTHMNSFSFISKETPFNATTSPLLVLNTFLTLSILTFTLGVFPAILLVSFLRI